MIRYLALLLLLSIGFAAPQPVLDARQSFVSIWTTNEQGEIRAVCSGFAIGPNLVATAGHCVSQAQQQWISTVDAPLERHPVTIVHRRFVAPLVDQALLRTEILLRPISMCKEMPELGETVWTWTGPLGLQALLRSGIYSGQLWNLNNPLWNRTAGGLHVTSINVDSGSSGSAVLRSTGCFWGIISKRFGEMLKLDGAIVVRYY